MSVEEMQAMMEKQQLEFQAMREAYQADLAKAQGELAALAQNKPEFSFDQGQGPAPEVGSVAIRLPTFWVTRPEMWFYQTEASFETRNPKITTDMSKYNHVLQALPADVLNDCEHVIKAQGPDRYVALKAALIKAYGKTQDTKNAELLELATRSAGLGDKRPSSMLMKIRNLSGSSYEALERAMFLNTLPVTVRTALAGSKAANNDDLAAEADAIMEQVLLANRAGGVPGAISNVEVDAVNRRQSRGPYQAPSSSPSFRRPDTLCYLHRKYGSDAYACRSPNCPMKDRIRQPPAGNGRAGR